MARRYLGLRQQKSGDIPHTSSCGPTCYSPATMRPAEIAAVAGAHCWTPENIAASAVTSNRAAPTASNRTAIAGATFLHVTRPDALVRGA